MWEKFDIYFDYRKMSYDVLLPNGDIVLFCWPNAGKMNCTRGTGRQWTTEDGIMVRESKEKPWKRGD